MSDIVAVYNALPHIEEAHVKFTNRDEVFAKLTPFIAKHNYVYGVCLVHGHTKLEAGEVMVSTSDSVTEPISSPSKSYHPERWLATGQPYEFTYEPTVEPPPEVFEEFSKIVGPGSPLGLFFVDVNAPTTRTETTDGRKSVTRPGLPDEGVDNLKWVEAAWVPGRDIIVYGICVYSCTNC
ncbi:hypothetical protein K439DRAFT_1630373 [Ramaria rubella]|nr:hypothetical protein K439DRAFT_1630373 [Ramaria rubella]